MDKGTAIAVGAGAVTAAIGAVILATVAKAKTTIPCPSGDVSTNLLGQCPSGYTPDSASPGCCKAVSPPPSSCQCPSGDVCQASDGSCASGYYPDPNNAGCCAVCSQQTCACDEVFDSTLCQCSKLIPSAIKMSSEVSVNPFWMLYLCCDEVCSPGGYCAGFEGINLSSCKFVSGQCNHDALNIQIKGTVVDSAGHPICNVPLDWSSTLSGGTIGTIPFVTPDNVFEGEFSVSLGLDGSTGSNGEFYIDITVNISITAVSDRCCDVLASCSGQYVRPTPVNFSITGEIAGTNISATTIVVLNNILCEWIAL